jgi:hypothetical protein
MLMMDDGEEMKFFFILAAGSLKRQCETARHGHYTHLLSKIQTD